jgi:TPR repeat protein
MEDHKHSDALKRSADEGDVAAQFHRGFMLHNGDGTPMNKSLAVHFVDYLQIKAMQKLNCIMV